MHTSYEDRLSRLKKFHHGSEAIQAKVSGFFQTKGDGWELASLRSPFAMFNGVLIYSSRKDCITEVLDAIKQIDVPAHIRLVGPGLSLTGVLAEHGYKNFGGTPFMMWTADNSVDSFGLREGLTARLLIESDLARMCAIYKDVYAMTDEMIADMKKMFFLSPKDHTYGLFKDNEMVSLVTAIVYEDTVGIWSMGTPTEHQKNGYGQQLLQHVMKTHKDLGTKEFYLHASTAGKFLYDKCGWITLDYLPYLAKPSGS